ncbi:hypothetical protein O3P69_003081 [Scylla paramamosain]|uniref:Secreted protein n=1 Tax=Scylla paramamosain TaxID=85552 RepID=A0AAW0UNC1_SCYPA
MGNKMSTVRVSLIAFISNIVVTMQFISGPTPSAGNHLPLFTGPLLECAHCPSASATDYLLDPYQPWSRVHTECLDEKPEPPNDRKLTGRVKQRRRPSVVVDSVDRRRQVHGHDPGHCCRFA